MKQKLINFYNNNYLKHISVICLFITLILIFYYPSIISRNYLLPTDIYQDYDTLLDSDNVKAHNPLIADIPMQFIPYKFYNAKEPGLTFWNPYSLGGLPYFADSQSAQLELTNLIAEAINIPLLYFFQFQALILLLFAGFTMYLFLRTLNLNKFAVIFGASAYMLSSPFLIWINYSLGSAFIWLPFLFLCIEKSLKFKTIYLPLLSVGIAFQLFAGQPQASIISLFILIVYFFVRIYQINVIKEYKKYLPIIIFLILGITLSAIQSIPSLQFIAQSQAYENGRGAGGSFIEETVLQFESPLKYIKIFIERLKNYLTIIFFPNHFGNPVDRNYSFPENPALNNFFATSAYAGLTTIIFAMGSLIFIKKKKILFWVLLAIFSFALYADLPFVNIISHLPIVKKINLERLSFIFIFTICVLSTIFISELFKIIKIKKRLGLVITKGLIFMILIIILNLDLNLNFGFLNNPHSAKLNELQNNEIIKFLQGHPHDRVIGITENNTGIHQPLLPNQSIIYEIEDLRGYFIMQPVRFNTIASKYMHKLSNYFFATENINQEFLNLYSVKYIICPKEHCSVLLKTYPIILETDSALLLENRHALPRAFISHNLISKDHYYRISNDFLSSGQKTFKQIPSLINGSKINFNNEVIRNRIQFNKHNNLYTSSVKILDYKPDKIILETDELTSDGILVLTNNFYPGWQATVVSYSGNLTIPHSEYKTYPVPIYNSLQGIKISHGKNIVTLKYQPPYFILSYILTIISLIMIISLSIYFKINK